MFYPQNHVSVTLLVLYSGKFLKDFIFGFDNNSRLDDFDIYSYLLNRIIVGYFYFSKDVEVK